jgi:hypothetical protein
VGSDCAGCSGEGGSSGSHLGQPRRGVAWPAQRTTVACTASTASPTAREAGMWPEQVARGAGRASDGGGEERVEWCEMERSGGGSMAIERGGVGA